MAEENPKIGSGIVAIGAGLVGYVAGYLTKNVVAEQIEQPGWAKNVINNLQIWLPEKAQYLNLHYIGKGGWRDTICTNYLGSRDTGIDMGGPNAWVTLALRATGQVQVRIAAALAQKVFYMGTEIVSLGQNEVSSYITVA